MFEKEYLVHVYETGPGGRLALHSLFDYLQDIASDHAVRLGYGRDDLIRKNQYWVLSRMYAVIHKLPSWGEKILVKTWPKGTDKVFALRDYEAFLTDGEPVASATSSWLIIDLDTKRIRRPDETISDHSRGERKDSLPRNAERLDPVPADAPVVSNFNVRISDLDVNLHTNNVKYLKWMTDSLDLDFALKYIPYSAEINYLAESRFNDNIIIRVSEDKYNKNSFSNSILRLSDSTELCRIKTEWRINHADV